MAQAPTKVPVKSEKITPLSAGHEWWPFESLHREIDRLFDDFGRWRVPVRRSLFDWKAFEPEKTLAAPAVDIAENDKAYEITAELPGMNEKDVQVNVANGGLTIKGEKKEEKEEKEKDYYLSERRYGSFQRYFSLPETVDVDKIEAAFNNGLLKVTLPKKLEAQKPEKKIEIKAS